MNELSSNQTMFIGIGAQKAGTTWMSSYFSSHPEVFMSPLKELHYFNAMHIHPVFNSIFVKEIRKILTDTQGQLNKQQMHRIQLNLERLDITNNDKYMSFFKKRVKQQKVFGEITPAYSMLTSEVYEEMNELHSNVKFIFGMRNPVERFWSHLRFVRKFDKSFNPEENFYQKLNDREFVKRTDYQRTIMELEKVIDKDNIFYYFYEDLFSEKGNTVIKKLTDFLGISYIEADFDKNINVSDTLLLDEKLHKIAQQKFQPIVDFVSEHFNGHIPSSWKNI